MDQAQAAACILAVHRSGSHSFSKFAEEAITLVAGLGVQGDAHSGTIAPGSRKARASRTCGRSTCCTPSCSTN
jgi:hypothetical protein